MQDQSSFPGVIKPFGLVLMAVSLLAAFALGRFWVQPQSGLHVDRTPIPKDLLPEEERTVALFRNCSNSVVFITNKTTVRDFFRGTHEVPRGSGSGFVWDEKGHIVTNYHVIRGADELEISFSDRSSWSADPVGIAPEKDLAVIRLRDMTAQPKLVPVEVGQSSRLVVGQNVYAIGNPFGLDQSLTKGVVSALGRSIETQDGAILEGLIQADAPINPGNSGGPLINSFGEVVGINTAIVSPTNASAGIGFAVPIDTVSRYIPHLIQFGRVQRPSLGIETGSDANSYFRVRNGLMITRVTEGSPAAKAGLRGLRESGRRVEPGDVMISLDGKELRSLYDLWDVLEDHAPGDKVKLTYVRNLDYDEERETTIELGPPIRPER